MLGVCLLFVGIVLINNGICNFYKVDGKSLAVMNIFTFSVHQLCKSCAGKLLRSRNRTSVLLHLFICGSQQYF